MKRIKRLLVMLCVIALGMTAIPVRAEVVEVDKPTEQKKVTVQQVYFSKAAYHEDENIKLYAKINGLNEQDIENIKYINASSNYFSCNLYYDRERKLFEGEMSSKKKGSYPISFVRFHAYSYDDKIDSAYQIESYRSVSSRLVLAINNNCADDIHTIYKDNWQTEEYATCVKKGLQTIRCNICNQIVKSEEIPMTPHKISGCQARLYNGKQYFFYLCSCGKIMGKEPCSSKSNNKTSKNTANNKAITKLRFVKKSVTIKKGKTIKLKYICKPANTKNKLIWKNSNPKIVKILSNSKVRGLKKGKATIILKSGNKKTKIVIKVK